jgi:hypothetical protein
VTADHLLPDEPVAGLELRSEFAHVRVHVDRNANGDRLAVTDLRSGAEIFLDPLELERLTTARHRDLAGLMRPRPA